jgi:Fe-S-cluster-containing dehydrogenase component/CRP-like cAMP-binding protein
MDSSDILLIRRPQRWDHPLDPTITNRDVQWLLLQPPFAQIDDQSFPSTCKVKDILRNDTRIVRYQPGDIIVREGDYGSCAYLILSGAVRVILSRLASSPISPQQTSKKLSMWAALKDSLRTWPIPEKRVVASSQDSPTRMRQLDDRPRVYIQDVSAVLVGHESEPLGHGEIFGELAAMTRSASNYSVVATEDSIVLEIRWQGLRLLRRDPQFREYLDARYRATSLRTHLRESWLFKHLPDQALSQLVASTELASYGEMEWFASFESSRKLDVQKQLHNEPLIAEEGSTVNHLYLVRAGFARQSHRLGGGNRTIAYLGKGQVFGLTELAHNFRSSPGIDPLPHQHSLRAMGFIDVLKIPKLIVYQHVLPYVREQDLPPLIETPRIMSDGRTLILDQAPLDEESLKPSLLEFLVDERLINGRNTMIIDTERCTRCDDCVTACAKTHQGNPRFIRSGLQHENWLFPHACMHCTDPVCMIGCPTGAIARDPDTGIIAINPETCIGCSTCANSCPYENIVMVQIHDEKGRKLVDQSNQLPILQATKCDFCQTQVNGPACVASCPHDALIRIDMSDMSALRDFFQRKSA